MSDVEKTLNEVLQNVVERFDFDGTLSANCAELLTYIDEFVPEISATYWNYWAGMRKFEEFVDC